jgi:hypothetical protein
VTISRRDFETKALAALVKDHSRGEILAAIDSYTPPSNKRRPKHNAGNLHAIWVAVEWKRDQSKNGGRHSVKRACELLAEDLKSIKPESPTVARSPGWSRLKARHHDAETIAQGDTAFKKLLSESLAEKRATLHPDDELIPMILVGDGELIGWLRFSDHPNAKIVA